MPGNADLAVGSHVSMLGRIKHPRTHHSRSGAWQGCQVFSHVHAKMGHQPGSIIEAAALVAGAMVEMCMISKMTGTTVGAGILGLPLATRMSG